MQENFPGYYKFKKEVFEKLWRDCIFVFDTNVLLNLYRYKKTTREELLRILKIIKYRLWIPHQVALEFHNERLNVIKSLMAAYDKIDKMETENYNNIKKELNNYKERHPVIDVEKITKLLDGNHTSISDELKKEKDAHPDYNSQDDIRDIIYSIFDGKVGDAYSQEALEIIYKRGELRYSLEIPPGYKDKNEKHGFAYKEYGDLVLWLQLMDESKRSNKPMIFVTDDAKKDWFSEPGVPRPELIQEFFLETGNILYSYSPKDFIKWSKEYLEITITEDAIKEIEDVKRGDEKFFGDAPNRSIDIIYEEIEGISPIDRTKISDLGELIKNELYNNPKLTEDEANELALKSYGNIISKYKVKIKLGKRVDGSMAYWLALT